MVGTRPLEGDLAAGDAHGGEERPGFDAVRDHGVVDWRELVDALDLDRGGPAADDAGAHAHEEGSQVGDLRLASCVVDHGRSLGAHGSHEKVLGGTDARELEHDAGADQLVAPGLDVAVRRLEAHAEGLEAADVHVDGSGAEVVTPGQGDPRVPVAGQEGAEHDDRRPHLFDELVGRLGGEVGPHVDGENMVFDAAHVGTHRDEEVAHDLDVDDVRDVAQHETTFSDEAGRHQLEDGVLRPLDGDRALEGAAAPHDDLIHALSMV